MNTITISLKDLKFYAFHGVMAQEAMVGNEFVVDVNIRIEAGRLEAMVKEGEEDLNRTISYADIFDIIKKEMDVRSQLLETVAIRIADILQKTFPQIIEGKIRITKVTPPISGINGSAAVTYSWG